MDNVSITSIRRNYSAALLILGFISIVSHISLYNIIPSRKHDAKIINIAGRQRMLAQRIAMLSERLYNIEKGEDRSEIRKELSESVELMEKSHLMLISGNAGATGALTAFSPEVRGIYMNPPESLDMRISGYASHARALSMMSEEELRAGIPHLYYIRTASGELLRVLDMVVSQCQGESEKKVAFRQKLETGLLTGNLAVLGMIAFFLFRPMLNQIKNTMEKLEDANRLLKIQAENLKVSDRKKSDFVTTVSHELRTPLTSIHAAINLVSGGIMGDIPDQASSLLGIATNNTERLVRLINNILDLEKIESGQMIFNERSMEIISIIEDAVKSNRSYASQKRVEIKIIHSIAGAKAKVDSDRLLQVLTNLLSNAVKYSPEGGIVEVTAYRDNGNIRVSVIDSGPGIPEEFRERLFQKFAQAGSPDTRQHCGTGLGLSISKAIIEMFGGKIGFVSDALAGTSFYFDLPECNEQEAPAVIEDQASGPSISRPRILVCEDNRGVAALLKAMLKINGFDVDLSFNAEQARNKLCENRYHAITVDISLPGQDGISFIRDLGNDDRTRSVPVVVVSAFKERGMVELRDETCKVFDWVTKPIDRDKLIKTLKRAVME